MPDAPAVAAPAHLQGEGKVWAALGWLMLASAVASGPVTSWPTLEPLLMAEGVFQGSGGDDGEASYEAIYSLGLVVLLATGLPAGLLFDRYGGRALGCGGAVTAAVGLVLMAVAARWPDKWDWLLFVGYPIAMLGGTINTFSLYSFIWLLPDHQNTVNGIAAGIPALSDMLALVAVWLHNAVGLPISAFFLGLAAASLAAAAVSLAVAPPQDYCMACAAAHMAAQVGGTAPPVDGDSGAPESVRSVIVRAWGTIKRRPTASSLVVAWSTVYCLAMMYPIQGMLFYYRALWGTESTTPQTLVNVFAVVFGAGGFVCAIGGGYLCDRVGLVNFTLAVSACALSTAVLLVVPTPAAQIAAQLDLTLGMGLYLIVILRYCILYSPPELFGSMSGLLFTIVSVFMGIGTVLIGAAAQAAFPNSTVLQYQAPYVFLGVLSAVLGVALAAYWRRNPPPTYGGEDAHDNDNTEPLLPGGAKADGDATAGSGAAPYGSLDGRGTQHQQ